MRHRAGLWTLALLCSAPLQAGTFYGVHEAGLFEDPLVPGNVPPYAIVHPAGWTGQSGTYTVKLCVPPGRTDLELLLDWAITIWNCRLAKSHNCQDCRTVEDLPTSETEYPMASVFLHEVGHCIGLGHPNLIEDFQSTSKKFRTGTCDVDSMGTCTDVTSFTDALYATEITPGAGGPGIVRGDGNETYLNQCGFVAPLVPDADAFGEAPSCDPSAAAPTIVAGSACSGPGIAQCCPPCPGAECPTSPMFVQHLAWFRRADNNPVVIDNTVIDRTTYSRAPADLPAGHAYAANGNRRAAAALGFPDTQAVMYSQLDQGEGWRGLTADDINQLRMAMTGIDRLANTADDYNLVLQRVADCAQADIDIVSDDLPGSGILGLCEIGDRTASLEPLLLSFPQSNPVKLHWSLNLIPKPKIILNEAFTVPYHYLVPLPSSGYESGSLVGSCAEWSAAWP